MLKNFTCCMTIKKRIYFDQKKKNKEKSSFACFTDISNTDETLKTENYSDWKRDKIRINNHFACLYN